MVVTRKGINPLSATDGTKEGVPAIEPAVVSKPARKGVNGFMSNGVKPEDSDD